MAAKKETSTPLKKTTLRLPQDLHRRLKIRAAQEDRQMGDVLTEAVEKYLAKPATKNRVGK